MFDSVDYVRGICERHGVPVSKLEKDCGFSNGYLNPKKLKKIPYDRAIVIAEYLSQFEPITAEYIMTGKEKAPTQEGERDKIIVNPAYFRVMKDAQEKGIPAEDIQAIIDFLERSRRRDQG